MSNLFNQVILLAAFPAVLAYVIWKAFVYLSAVLPNSVVHISKERLEISSGVESKIPAGKIRRVIRTRDDRLDWCQDAGKIGLPERLSDVYYLSNTIEKRNDWVRVGLVAIATLLIPITIYIVGDSWGISYRNSVTLLIVMTTSIACLLIFLCFYMVKIKHANAVALLNEWLDMYVDPRPYLSLIKLSIDLEIDVPFLPTMDFRRGHAYYRGSLAGKIGAKVDSCPYLDEVLRSFWIRGWQYTKKGNHV
ncbi:hypothetical protein KBW71_01115 [Hydrogenophaga aromaticivorans]|uniref:ribosome modulation factor n=1 Tax=Hydrogenophaga aromaticivorans TaxID=2610898 RepID=UPI000CAE3555|nr:Rmf/CrpP family protein [Hydrogenophaga aromaticivorans]MBQ0917030.1 hypothetical protein [Hydrogenophaga aromaticivorans]PKO59076.1 MAG: hypothetical protein CVU24_16030 [Betaproteobacteria bacterium HGW-Betaproteobacteria-18]